MAWEGLLGELDDEEEQVEEFMRFLFELCHFCCFLLQEQVKGFVNSRDNLILLIDGRANMFERNGEGQVRWLHFRANEERAHSLGAPLMYADIV